MRTEKIGELVPRMMAERVNEMVRAAVDAECTRLIERRREGLMTDGEVKEALDAFARGSSAALAVVAKALRAP